MPTVLTKEYLAGLAKEAAKEAAAQTVEASAVLRRDMDAMKAEVAVQDRSWRMTYTQVQRLEARMDRLKQQAAAFQARVESQQAAHAQETMAALREMRNTQREISKQAGRNRETMERVLARFAAEENRRGK